MNYCNGRNQKKLRHCQPAQDHLWIPSFLVWIVSSADKKSFSSPVQSDILKIRLMPGFVRLDFMEKLRSPKQWLITKVTLLGAIPSTSVLSDINLVIVLFYRAQFIKELLIWNSEASNRAGYHQQINGKKHVKLPGSLS